MPAPEILGSLILKLLGSVAGTVLALIFALPKNWRDFQRRGMFSLLAGVVLTPFALTVLRRFIDIPADPETLVAVAAMTAFASWSAAGTFQRIIKAGPWKPPEG